MDIKISNLNISYPGKEIYKDFNITFKENTTTCILGESGIGKTTLLNAIANQLPYTGTIEKDGNDISYIFQNDRLIPGINVYKNLDLVLKSKINDKDARKKIIEDILDKVDLKNEINSFPNSLSGGMKSRISLARGYIYPSKILLMDESFKGLDIALKLKLIDLFRKLFSERNRTIVMVTHTIDEALLMGDRIIILKDNPCIISLDENIDIPILNRDLLNPTLLELKEKILNKLM